MHVSIVPTVVAPPSPREGLWRWTEDHIAATDRLLEQRIARPGAAAAPPDVHALPVNAYVADEALVVEALLPGISPEDVQVTLERDVLTLTATRHGPTPASGRREPGWSARELEPGVFTRALRLPFAVAGDGVTADFAHGRLRITAPKAAAARARIIPIGPGQPPEPLPTPASR